MLRERPRRAVCRKTPAAPLVALRGEQPRAAVLRLTVAAPLHVQQHPPHHGASLKKNKRTPSLPGTGVHAKADLSENENQFLLKN